MFDTLFDTCVPYVHARNQENQQVIVIIPSVIFPGESYGKVAASAGSTSLVFCEAKDASFRHNDNEVLVVTGKLEEIETSHTHMGLPYSVSSGCNVPVCNTSGDCVVSDVKLSCTCDFVGNAWKHSGPFTVV